MANIMVNLKHFSATAYNENLAEEFNLSSLVYESLKQKKLVGSRIQKLAEAAEAGETLFISNYALHGDTIFGVFVHADTQHLPLASETTKSEMVQLKDLLPADQEKSQKYIRHFTYFAIRDNSVVYIEKNGIRVNRFRLHLSFLLGWLQFQLSPTINEALPNGINWQDVAEVIVPPEFFEATANEPKSGMDEFERTITRNGKNAAEKVLQGLGLANKDFDDYLASELLAITLTIKMKKRKVDERKKEISQHLSALPDYAVINTRKGVKIEGRSFKKQRKVPVKVLDTGNQVLDESELYGEMASLMDDTN